MHAHAPGAPHGSCVAHSNRPGPGPPFWKTQISPELQPPHGSATEPPLPPSPDTAPEPLDPPLPVEPPLPDAPPLGPPALPPPASAPLLPLEPPGPSSLSFTELHAVANATKSANPVVECMMAQVMFCGHRCAPFMPGVARSSQRRIHLGNLQSVPLTKRSSRKLATGPEPGLCREWHSTTIASFFSAPRLNLTARGRNASARTSLTATLAAKEWGVGWWSGVVSALATGTLGCIESRDQRERKRATGVYERSDHGEKRSAAQAMTLAVSPRPPAYYLAW
jgi:hypothetical protein